MQQVRYPAYATNRFAGSSHRGFPLPTRNLGEDIMSEQPEITSLRIRRCAPVVAWALMAAGAVLYAFSSQLGTWFGHKEPASPANPFFGVDTTGSIAAVVAALGAMLFAAGAVERIAVAITVSRGVQSAMTPRGNDSTRESLLRPTE
jgi:hypothetical protein